jgi:predicted nuclease of restriction endonuclease-like RecB superfamily
MLLSEHAVLEFKHGWAVPDRLTQKAHGHYLPYAEKMLAVYRSGAGQTRNELHFSIENILNAEPNCPNRRIQAFCKLLDDRSDFQTDPDGKAGRLRLKVFEIAAHYHPLVRQTDQLFETGEEAVKAQIARALDRPWPEIERDLYADVIQYQRLEKFASFPTPEDLLKTYNIGQLQACLYRAVRMSVTVAEDFKIVLRYAKLARLIHDIFPAGPSRYRIDFSGPASLLTETRRYGVNFAKFLPALLVCRNWSMTADIQTPWRTPAKLKLSSADGFSSHFPPSEEFDSKVEEDFAAKFGAEQNGWRLGREEEILYQDQKVFIPDFTFTHQDGTRVLLEIVGFWTPEYLAKKRETLHHFCRHNLLIAVPEKSLRANAVLGEKVITYKTALKPAAVLEALERMRR